jgi:competence protein ComEC
MKRSLAALAACCALVGTARGGDEALGKFTITLFPMPDVAGCGLAVLLETPGEHYYLYDTGVAGAKDQEKPFDAGRDVIGPYLHEQRIGHLNGIIISHAHGDHFGGLAWLLEHVPTECLIDSGYVAPPDLPWGELRAYEKIRHEFQATGHSYAAVHAGDLLALDGAIEAEVLAPPRGFFTEKRPETRPQADPAAHYLPNKNSLVIRIRHGKVVFLFGGDLEDADQAELLREYFKPAQLRANVLIAPGHGIHSNADFAKAVQPEIVAVSCFARYHGTQRAEAVYTKLGAKVYGTDTHGRIQITSDGQKCAVVTERTPAK